MECGAKRNYDTVNMINSESIKKIFGSNLKKLRLQRKLTQEQLAEFLDLQVQTISFVENGRAFVSSDVYAKICNFFDISLEFMFKPKFREQSSNEEYLKKEIIQMMSDCNEETLIKYRNILFCLKN